MSQINADGRFIYTPKPGAVGVDTFTYEMVRSVAPPLPKYTSHGDGHDRRASGGAGRAAPRGKRCGEWNREGSRSSSAGPRCGRTIHRANYIPYVGTNLFRGDTWDTYGGSLSISYGQIFPDAAATTGRHDPDIHARSRFAGVDSFTYWVATQYPWNTSSIRSRSI